MKRRLTGYLVTTLLALLAAISGLLFYSNVSFGRAMADLIRGLGVKAGNPSIAWDDWFFLAISVSSLLAIAVWLKRERLARFLSLLVFGVSLGWAMIMAALPEIWLEKEFSMRIDRWAAVVAAIILATAFALIFSHGPSNDSQPAEAAC